MEGVFEFKANKSTGETQPTGQELIEAASRAGLDGVDLDARGPIDKPMVDALLAAGVRGITTNRPGWLRNELEQGA